MSEHEVTPGSPGFSEDIPAGSTASPDDDLDLPRERLDDDFDVATAREQVREESRHVEADRPGSRQGDPEVVDGS
ncbi:MAG: hypothetical protein ACYC1E_03075 [Propionibacteriaceae bacterium]